ncbi:MAG: efflux RND transporter permease subunit [Candidatus Zhuqueibacterota bacterium]
MNLIKLSIERPVAVSMFFLAVIVTGFMSLSRLPLELTPDVDYPQLSVTTSWPNSSAEMVEAFITAPIEAVAQTLADVHKVSSVSNEGSSSITIELLREANVDFIALELNEKLAVIRKQLPYGSTAPKIDKYIPREFQTEAFLSYQLFGDFTPLEVRQYALKHIHGALLGVDGVADVLIFGGQDEEIHIVLDEAKMKLLGLRYSEITSAIREMSVESTAGRIYRGDYKYDIVVRNPIRSVAEISSIQMKNDRNQLVRLYDIARINHSVQDVRQISRINGNPAIRIEIVREPGTNTIKVADQVFAKIEELQKKFPATMSLIKEFDQSERIRKELKDLTYRALFSIVVIFLVLLFFMRRFRLPFIILSTIFFSVLLTINFFYAADIGLNLLTLAGLSLGFGMLVDNAIVVLDSIYRHWRNNLPLKDACIQGTSAVSLAIVTTTLTTVVAFLPFLYLTGTLRLYYFPFVSSVGFSLLSSLLIAFTFMPSLANQILRREFSLQNQPPRQRYLDTKGRAIYQQLLKWTLGHRFVTVLLTALILSGSFYIFDKYVTKGQIWSGWGSDTYVAISIGMPAGADIENTDKVARFFEEKLIGQKGVQKFVTNIYNKEQASIRVTFPDSLHFTTAPLIVKEKMTAAAVQLAGISISVYGFGPGFYSGGGGSSASFRLKVLGYNYNEVKNIAEHVGQKLQRYSRVRDVDVSSSGWGWRDNRSEITLTLDRDEIAKYKLSNFDVLQQVQAYLRESLDLSKLKIDGREVSYRIKMEGYHNFTLEDFKNLLLVSPAGESVRLERLASIDERKVMSSIVREDQQYRRWVTFEYRGPYKLGDQLVETIIKTTHLPAGYELSRERWDYLQDKEKKQIYLVLSLSVLLVFIVTGALFESFRQPTIILTTIPLALIGIFLIFYLTDTNFDQSAYIGVIFLSGIVVNNGIILVDHINFLRRKGMQKSEAIITGASERVRPILMTTATTIFGLLPLVLFSQEEKSIWYSLSIATIGGLISSAFFVLMVIPVFYDLVSGKKDVR